MKLIKNIEVQHYYLLLKYRADKRSWMLLGMLFSSNLQYLGDGEGPQFTENHPGAEFIPGETSVVRSQEPSNDKHEVGDTVL